MDCHKFNLRLEYTKILENILFYASIIIAALALVYVLYYIIQFFIYVFNGIDLDKEFLKSVTYAGAIFTISSSVITFIQNIKYKRLKYAIDLVQEFDNPDYRLVRNITRQIREQFKNGQISSEQIYEYIDKKNKENIYCKDIKEICESENIKHNVVSLEDSLIFMFNYWERVYCSLLDNTADEKYIKEQLSSVYIGHYERFNVWIENHISVNAPIQYKHLSDFYKKLKPHKVFDLIITLTSYPARINTVSPSIKSLLSQTIEPENIILWLAEEQFPNKEKDLPNDLLELRNGVFQIKWCKDIRSYKKIIPTLSEYPDKIIISCDDDIIYEKNRVEKLYNEHKKHPTDVLCHRAHYITFDKNKQIKPYKQWLQECFGELNSYNVFPTTGAMVLYPPHCFHKDVLNEDVFMSKCDGTDDIWFWAMCVLNNKKPRLIKNNINKLDIIDDSQDTALYKNNIDNGINDINLENLIKKYPDLCKNLTTKKPVKILDNIFSIKIKQKHKIITILWFKIKLKKR